MKAVPDLNSFHKELSEMESHFFERQFSYSSPKGNILQNLITSPTFSSQFSQYEEVPILSRVKMIGILFAQPTHSLAKSEIIPNMNYFHYRSGHNINFYCAGYGDEFSLKSYPDRKQAGDIDSSNWLFSASAFNTFRSELEHCSNWKYSGETELLLSNARLDGTSMKVILDLQVAVICNLSKMKEENAITSIMSFFEDIFQYAEASNPDDPTWGFSDTMGKSKAISALRRLILSFLPKDLGADAERIAHFAVRDVSK